MQVRIFSEKKTKLSDLESMKKRIIEGLGLTLECFEHFFYYFILLTIANIFFSFFYRHENKHKNNSKLFFFRNG